MANHNHTAGGLNRAAGVTLSNSLVHKIEQAGQSSILRFWNELSPSEQREFASQLSSIDWLMVGCRRNQCLGSIEEAHRSFDSVQPPQTIIRRPMSAKERVDWEAARNLGEQSLRNGEVGVLLVAGGSGTRLGFDHPKGIFPIGPVTVRSLFQLFAEQILAQTRRYGAPIPLLIMTGESTHAETVAWFEKHRWFGLDSDNVFFFQQGWQPILNPVTGELLLAAKGELAKSADGHGGILGAIRDARLFDELRRRNIKTLFYHQVDNPLVYVCDPAFLGFHALHEAQVSTKVVCKSSPNERVGVVVEIDGRVQIIEYIDLPEKLASTRDSDGKLRIRAGNTAIHAFQADFLERVAVSNEGLPWHRVRRAVPFVDASGNRVEPLTANALKFERFIFDVLPVAEKALVFEVDRDEEFSPLKNAEGENSPDEVRRAMTTVAAKQLSAAGIVVPNGIAIEISPLALLPDEKPVLAENVSLPIDGPWVIGPEHLRPQPNLTTRLKNANQRIWGPVHFESKALPRVWGGRDLGNVLGHCLETDEPYGEVWEISALPDQTSCVSNGPFRGKKLTDLWQDHACELFGGRVPAPSQFPLLIKWLECRQHLSLQVHPDDAMAQRVLNQPYGKSEAWIVLHAEPNARVMAGLLPGVTRDDFIRHLHAGTLEQCIHTFTPRAGDCIVLPAGTVHAAGGGLLIAEVQQSSDATFRLYDWNRMGLDGRPRPLQIEMALEAINWNQGAITPTRTAVRCFDDDGNTEETLANLQAFSLKRFTIVHPWKSTHPGELTIWMVLEGRANLSHSDSEEKLEAPRGRTFLIPAAAENVVWTPADERPVSLLCIRIPWSRP